MRAAASSPNAMPLVASAIITLFPLERGEDQPVQITIKMPFALATAKPGLAEVSLASGVLRLPVVLEITSRTAVIRSQTGQNS